MRDVQIALQEHYDAALSQGIRPEQIIGIFVYGSQNYGLATENSDVDTKCIYIPSFEDLCYNHTEFSRDYHLENDEICVLMDVRHFIENLKSQNINYLEILFNDNEHCYINPLYKELWNDFTSYKEDLARYDVKSGVLSQVYQAIGKLKPTSRAKDQATAYRIFLYLENYLKGFDYKTCITVDKDTADFEKILVCKSGVQLEEENRLFFIERLEEIKDIGKNVEVDEEKKADFDRLLKDFTMKTIKKYLHHQL